MPNLVGTNDDQQFLKQMGITANLIYPEHVSTDEELVEIRWRRTTARGSKPGRGQSSGSEFTSAATSSTSPSLPGQLQTGTLFAVAFPTENRPTGARHCRKAVAARSTGSQPQTEDSAHPPPTRHRPYISTGGLPVRRDEPARMIDTRAFSQAIVDEILKCHLARRRCAQTAVAPISDS